MILLITPDSVIFAIEVVALARTLADAGEQLTAAVLRGDVADELRMSTVLPTPAPPKRPTLPPRW